MRLACQTGGTFLDGESGRFVASRDFRSDSDHRRIGRVVGEIVSQANDQLAATHSALLLRCWRFIREDAPSGLFPALNACVE
jgi:hypothetical protein